jgi:hypothetical protein
MLCFYLVTREVNDPKYTLTPLYYYRVKQTRQSNAFLDHKSLMLGRLKTYQCSHDRCAMK